MEGLAVMGFIFGVSALSKVLLLEKKLKEKGIIKENHDKWMLESIKTNVLPFVLMVTVN